MTGGGDFVAAWRRFGSGARPGVTARRTAATGSPVPLLFARVVGISGFDAAAVSVAVCAHRPPGIIGIDSIDMGSHALTDSYDSAAGPYLPSTAGARGNIHTNGDIDLSGTVLIRGDARPGHGRRITLGPGVVVPGSTAPLESRLSFPAGSAGTAAVNNNGSIPSAFLSGGRLVLGGADVLRLPDPPEDLPY